MRGRRKGGRRDSRGETLFGTVYWEEYAGSRDEGVEVGNSDW